MLGRIRRPAARWRARLHHLRERRAEQRRQWAVEREIEDAVGGEGPIVAGPWLSEVGYEILYWVPFLRWVQAAYRIPPERIIAMSRGDTASWYRDIAGRYLDAFDELEPEALAARAAAGELKQRTITGFDRDVVERASSRAGISGHRMLHPSLMFRLFAPFWSGHEALGFVERHTRYALLDGPGDASPPIALPPHYAVVKFYAARALPDRPDVRAQLHTIVAALSERMPVVHLDTGLSVDEHTDFAFPDAGRILSVSGRLDARTNLAVQTRIIAGASLFVGTCGSLAWLAPLLRVPTIPVFADDAFLHAHLQIARRAYGRLGAARFAPVDLSGLVEAGLAIAAAPRESSVRL